jgi:hypothetical protein
MVTPSSSSSSPLAASAHDRSLAEAADLSGGGLLAREPPPVLGVHPPHPQETLKGTHKEITQTTETMASESVMKN